MSLIKSAPATMPATSEATFAPAAEPAEPGTVNSAPAVSTKPARCANAITGTRPADATRHESSKRANRTGASWDSRSEEHTSELQSRRDLVCRLLLEKKN